MTGLPVPRAGMPAACLPPVANAKARNRSLRIWGSKPWNGGEKAPPGHLTRHGTLVVASGRDNAEIDRFAARTNGHEKIGAKNKLGNLEPDLAGRFQNGLFYATEAHLDPRQALETLKNGWNRVVFPLWRPVKMKHSMILSLMQQASPVCGLMKNCVASAAKCCLYARQRYQFFPPRKIAASPHSPLYRAARGQFFHDRRCHD